MARAERLQLRLVLIAQKDALSRQRARRVLVHRLHPVGDGVEAASSYSSAVSSIASPRRIDSANACRAVTGSTEPRSRLRRRET